MSPKPQSPESHPPGVSCSSAARLAALMARRCATMAPARLARTWPTTRPSSCGEGRGVLGAWVFAWQGGRDGRVQACCIRGHGAGSEDKTDSRQTLPQTPHSPTHPPVPAHLHAEVPRRRRRGQHGRSGHHAQRAQDAAHSCPHALWVLVLVGHHPVRSVQVVGGQLGGASWGKAARNRCVDVQGLAEQLPTQPSMHAANRCRPYCTQHAP